MACGAATGLPAEKKSLHAQERDTEANRKRREEFVQTLRSIPPEKLIFLDESGVSTQMTPLYARCQGGARICEATPDSRWKILTILGAMSTRGMIATMTVEAATDREIFLTYLDECLCPKLQAGDVVVMDNLSSHKVEGVRQRIEKCGARLLYLPPYSPDLNPIETNMLFPITPNPESRPTFEDVFFEHHVRLHKWALQLTGRNSAEAEDLVQELYIRLARVGPLRAHSVPEIRSLRVELHTSAHFGEC